LSEALIRTSIGPYGEVLHVLAMPPQALPAVTKRDVELAWEAAQAGTARRPPPRGFRFTPPEGASVQLMLNDHDAAAWAVAVDKVADISTAYGISLCLRLLALVELMSRAVWLRPWFSLGRGGMDMHPALLQAAALLPLNDAAGFDESGLHALLPPL
jgi:hypothetical protein